MKPSPELPFRILCDCPESMLKQYNLACLNQIDILEKMVQETMSELAMWRGRLDVLQEVIFHRPEILEVLRAQVMKDAITVGPQHAERVEHKKSEAA